MEDKLLVLRCKRGSSDALRRIYEKYRNDLLILAIALLNDTSAAEDVLHDVFVSFVQGMKNFQLNGSLKSYLATCIANRARNINRLKHSQSLEAKQAEKLDADLKAPVQSIICNEELRQLGDALAQLPYEQREIVVLRAGGMRFKRIADSSGVSVNTVKSRYRYGIGKLRVILNGEVKK